MKVSVMMLDEIWFHAWEVIITLHGSPCKVLKMDSCSTLPSSESMNPKKIHIFFVNYNTMGIIWEGRLDIDKYEVCFLTPPSPTSFFGQVLHWRPLFLTSTRNMSSLPLMALWRLFFLYLGGFVMSPFEWKIPYLWWEETLVPPPLSVDHLAEFSLRDPFGNYQ